VLILAIPTDNFRRFRPPLAEIFSSTSSAEPVFRRGTTGSPVGGR
jgi:hypothetical protein